LAAQSPVIADGFFHFIELFRGQGDGNGLLVQFAGPLIAGTSALARPPILDRALADETNLTQWPAQLLVLPLQSGEGLSFFVHGAHFEERFAPHVPQTLFPKAAKKANSRDRIYTRPRTFWSMLWQAFNPKASCREGALEIQALFDLCGGPDVSEKDGAYCRAKARLPLSEFPKALSATAQAADKLAPPVTLLQGRPVKVADGSTLTTADTPKNRKRYAPVQTAKPNFPMMRVRVLFSLLSGAVLSLTSGDLRTAERPMLYQMLSLLAPNDILMGDRGFGNFVLLALRSHLKLGVDFIGRSARHTDGRRHRLQPLGRDDWLVVWKKGSNPSLWLPKLIWKRSIAISSPITSSAAPWPRRRPSMPSRWSGSVSRALWMHCASSARRYARHPLKGSAPNCGPECSKPWPAIWCATGPGDANHARSNASKTNTRA